MKENPDIKTQFFEAFDRAQDRGDYYEARYLMSKGEQKQARNAMRNIRCSTKVYSFLTMLTYSRILWTIFHSNYIKRNLVRLMGYVT